MGSRIAALLGSALVGLACTTTPETRVASGDRRLDRACSRFSPSMRTAVLEAMVYGGGPASVGVAGWMCGNLRQGHVRIIMLEYPDPDEPTALGALVPVTFEHGALIAFGWHLLEAQPERYGPLLPDRRDPWRVPKGWAALRYPPRKES